MAKASSSSGRRDVGGGIVKSSERKRVTLALGDRIIKAPPSGPVQTKEWSGHVAPVRKAMSIYLYPTKTAPHYKTGEYMNQVDNVVARRDKYRTQFAREYVAPASTSQYRERDKVRPHGQYNIRH